MSSIIIPEIKHQNTVSNLRKHLDGEGVDYTDAYRKAAPNDRAELLQWLSSTPYSKHHAETCKDVLPASGAWLFSEKSYLDWSQSNKSCVLQLIGESGAGKTKLTSTVIEHLKSSAPEGYDPTQLAYFYCASTTSQFERRLPASCILGAILRQLASTADNTAIRASVLDKYRENQKLAEYCGLHKPPSLTAQDYIELLLSITRITPVTLVLDGLAMDEYPQEDSDRDALYECLNALMQRSRNPVKVFVLSRNEEKILNAGFQYNISIESRSHRKDVAAWIERDAPFAETKYQICQKAAEKAGGKYISRTASSRRKLTNSVFLLPGF